MRVLAARGVASESELPFAALHQLLGPILDRLPDIPAPQAGALGRALGLSDDGGSERFLVFAGCLSLLAAAAEEGPLLCLIDDTHWLDGASADALLFVARRLGAEGIAILAGTRTAERDGLDSTGLPSLTLAGLDLAAAASLLEGAGLPVAAGGARAAGRADGRQPAGIAGAASRTDGGPAGRNRAAARGTARVGERGVGVPDSCARAAGGGATATARSGDR